MGRKPKPLPKPPPPKPGKPGYQCLRCHTGYFTLADAQGCPCPPSGHQH